MCFFVMGQVKERRSFWATSPTRGTCCRRSRARASTSFATISGPRPVSFRSCTATSSSYWGTRTAGSPRHTATFPMCGLRSATHSSPPSLYDDVIALLARRGLSIDAAALDRDWSVEYSPNASVESAWRQVYREAGADDELRRLGEALISLDQQFSLYRWRHFSSVERIIGYKPGTRWFGRHRMAGARHQTPFLPRDLGHQQLSVERDGHARIYGTSAT